MKSKEELALMWIIVGLIAYFYMPQLNCTIIIIINKMKNLEKKLNHRAMMLIEIYDYYRGKNINKEKLDLLTDVQLDNLYLEVQREKNEAKAEEIAVQLEKDIKNGLYGEEY